MTRFANVSERNDNRVKKSTNRLVSKKKKS